MKNLIIIVCGLLICTSTYSQKQIKGISTYFPEGDSIIVSESELKYLINNYRLVCSKIDTLDDGSMIKTVEIASIDTSFRFIGAYLESKVFFPEDMKLSIRLVCEFALVDNGELYESYELDSFGKKHFEKILNKVALVCIDPYD